METITFTAYDDVGTEISNISVTGIVTYNTVYGDKPLNQSVVRSLDGLSHSFGNSVYIVTAQIEIKGINYTEGENLIEWLRTDLDYGMNYLGIDLNGNDVNIGKGLQVDIDYSDSCRLSNDDGMSVTKLEAPRVHNITLKYEYRR